MENAAGGELFDMICRGKVKYKYNKIKKKKFFFLNINNLVK